MARYFVENGERIELPDTTPPGSSVIGFEPTSKNICPLCGTKFVKKEVTDMQFDYGKRSFGCPNCKLAVERRLGILYTIWLSLVRIPGYIKQIYRNQRKKS